MVNSSVYHWKIKSLKEIAFIKGGKRLPKGSKLLDEPTAYPYIRVADFSNSGTVSTEDIKFLAKADQEQIKNYIITVDDLYISIAGTIGKTGIIPQELNGANLTENAARLVFKDKGEVLNKYVYYYTLSAAFLDQAGIATKIVAQPKLALTRLSEILIPLPPIPEQRRIVDTLDNLFERIDKTIALVEQNITNARHLMASMLNEVFEECSRKYQIVRIAEIAKTKSGGTPSRSITKYWNGKIVWLKSGELNDSLNIIENTEFITEEGLNNSSANIFPKGTLLMAMYGATAGKLGILGMDASTNQAICSIQNDKGIFHPVFLFFYLFSIRERIIAESTGGAQPNISKNYIDNIEVPLPPIEEQGKYVKKFLALDFQHKQLITKHNEKLSLLASCKASILDAAFKGEL